MRYSFTQPICGNCWEAQNPDRPLTLRVIENVGDDETCCYCGNRTSIGLYTRVDPKTVEFPTITKD